MSHVHLVLRKRRATAFRHSHSEKIDAIVLDHMDPSMWIRQMDATFCSTSPFRGTWMDPSFLDICRRAALFPSPFNLSIRYLCTAVLLVVVSLSFAFARHVSFVLHSRRLSSFRATRSIPLNISPALHKPLLFHFPSPLLPLSLLDYLPCRSVIRP